MPKFRISEFKEHALCAGALNRHYVEVNMIFETKGTSSKYGTATGTTLQVPVSSLQQKTIGSKGFGRFWLWIGLAL